MQGAKEKSANVTPKESTDRTSSQRFGRASVESFESRYSHLSIASEDPYDVYPGIERMEYDFTAERENVNSTNLIQSTAYLIKGCLGAGVLAIHEAFMYGGLWTSLGVSFVICLICGHTMLMLVNSAQEMYSRLRVSRLTYPELAEVCLTWGPMVCLRGHAKIFRYIVEFSLFLELFSTCMIYLIMIASLLKRFLESVSKDFHDNDYSIRFYILFVSLPLTVCCMIRKLKLLATLSLLADVFIGICVIITMYYSISTIIESPEMRPAWKDEHGLFKFIGICIYSIEGIAVIMPIENHMASPKYFSTVVHWAMFVVISFIVMIGFLGYLAWGEACQTPVFVHMPKGMLPIVLQLLITISLGITFSVHFWVPFRIIWHYAGKKHRRSRHRVFWERSHRILHVMVVTAVAAAFPYISSIMIIVGAVCLALTGLVYPAFIEIMVFWRKRKIMKIIKDFLIICLAIIICVGVIYSVTV